MWGEDREMRYDHEEEIGGKKMKRDIQQLGSGGDHASSSSSSQSHHHQIMGMGTGSGRRHNLLGPPGTLNTVTPCAACKLLRRRCAEECPFSPYFSPHEPHKFAAVHKVFGASNVSKLLMEVPENQRADAANSLVYEANVRIRDPIYGCMGAIAALQQQIQALQAEVNAVRNDILKYKYREAATSSCNNILSSSSTHHHHQPHHHDHLVSSSSGTVSVAVLPSDHLHHHQSLPPPPPPPPPPPITPLPSINVVVSSCSSSTSSTTTTTLYTNPSTATAYSSITCDSSVPYFD